MRIKRDLTLTFLTEAKTSTNFPGSEKSIAYVGPKFFVIIHIIFSLKNYNTMFSEPMLQTPHRYIAPFYITPLDIYRISFSTKTEN